MAVSQKPAQADMDALEGQIGLALQAAQNDALHPERMRIWKEIADKFQRLKIRIAARPNRQPDTNDRLLYHDILHNIKLASRT